MEFCYQKIVHLMEQALQSLEDHIKCYGGQGKLAVYHPPTSMQELRTLEIHEEGLIMAALEAFPLKVSWQKLQWCTQKMGESPIDFISDLLMFSLCFLA